MLSDITQYYTNKEEKLEIKNNNYIGKCNFELCELPILEGEEFIHDGKIYCCKFHVDEQILYKKECE